MISFIMSLVWWRDKEEFSKGVARHDSEYYTSKIVEKGYKRLPEVEVNKLLDLIREGDESSRNMLIESMIPYVLHIVKKMKSEDMIQNGMEAMIEAIDDYKIGCDFPLYSHIWYKVRQRTIREMGRNVVRVPANMLLAIRRVMDLIKCTPDISRKDILKVLNDSYGTRYTKNNIDFIMKFFYKISSLDYENEDGFRSIDNLKSKDMVRYDECIEMIDDLPKRTIVTGKLLIL